jgi:hypothetical protein
MRTTARIATSVMVALAACGSAAGTAAAASGHPAGRTFKFPINVPVSFGGHVVVEFHGDSATGCEARGLCGYTGTIQWTPAPGWQLQINRLLPGPGYSVSLQTSGGLEEGPGDGGVTDADSQQQLSGVSPPGSACADAALSGGQIALPLERGEVMVGLDDAFPSIVQTRCPGPLITDVASALPVAAARLRTLMNGGNSVDLRGRHRFAANGFAGTVDSTLTLRFGKPQHGELQLPPPGRETRYRILTAAYDVAFAGNSVDQISGDQAPGLCGPLGACGVAGTVSVQPGIGDGGAELEAEGPARLPYRDFLAALHLNDGGRAPRSISVDGILLSRHGVATADLSRGGVSCTDSVQLSPEQMFLFVGRSRLEIEYQLEDSESGDVFRTRCPGPFGPQGPVLGTGGVSLSELARSRFALQLLGRPAALDDGYTEQLTTHLTLTFTRVSVTSRFVRSGD